LCVALCSDFVLKMFRMLNFCQVSADYFWKRFYMSLLVISEPIFELFFTFLLVYFLTWC